MKAKKHFPELSRRQFLRGTFRGLPVFVAMPTLLSLMPKRTWAADAVGTNNFLYMYIPDGTFPHKINAASQSVVYDHKMSLWYPKTGAFGSGNLPLFLKNLNNYKNDFSLLSGFKGYSQGHLAPAYALTGNTTPASDLAKNLNFPNDSIDQVIGSHLAGGSKNAGDISKYVVNTELPGEAGGTELHIKLSHHMTFLNHQPTLVYTSPSKLFKSIFGGSLPTNPDGNQQYINSLDLVLDDIKTKMSSASKEDKQTLERWLSGYEELQKQFGANSSVAAAAASCDSTKPPMPSESLDAAVKADLFMNYDQICKANMDIMVAAMECGARRVGTLMMMSETTKAGKWDEAVATQDLHQEAGRSLTLNDMKVDKHIGMAHYGDEGSDMLKYMRLVSINNYFMRKYTYLIDQLKTRNMMDNSLAICSYSFRCGNHKGGNHDYPILVAGKAGGFKTGFHHRMSNKTPEDSWGSGDNGPCKPLSNLWVSTLKKLYGINYTDGTVNGNVDGIFG